MHRRIVQPGQQVLDLDFLYADKYPYFGIGRFFSAALGSGPAINGMPCTPGTGLNVVLGSGEIYISAVTDTTAYGSLPADSHLITKQGILLDADTFSTPAPTTVGQSICYLIEVQYQETDGGAQVLNFYDVSNPNLAYRGPDGSEAASYTVRQDICAVQVKAGTPATTGAQITPPVDAGWTGLWVVTVAYGETQIIQSNISEYPNAPFLTNNLLTLSQAGQRIGDLIVSDNPAVPVNYLAADGSVVLQSSYLAAFVQMGHQNAIFTTHNFATGLTDTIEALCSAGSALFAISSSSTKVAAAQTTSLTSWTSTGTPYIGSGLPLIQAAAYDGTNILAFDASAGVYSVAPSSGNVTKLSPTGLTLTSITSAVAVGSTIIVGGASSGAPAMAYTTNHGANWTTITLPSGSEAATIAGLATDGANVVAVYDYTGAGNVLHSANGTTGYAFVSVSSFGMNFSNATTPRVQSVNGQFFYLGGLNSIFLSSPTGATWSAIIGPTGVLGGLINSQPDYIIYNGGAYLILGSLTSATQDFVNYTFASQNLINITVGKPPPVLWGIDWMYPAVSGAVTLISPTYNMSTQFPLPNYQSLTSPVAFGTYGTSPVPITAVANSPYAAPSKYKPYYYVKVQ